MRRTLRGQSGVLVAEMEDQKVRGVLRIANTADRIGQIGHQVASLTGERLRGGCGKQLPVRAVGLHVFMPEGGTVSSGSLHGPPGLQPDVTRQQK